MWKLWCFCFCCLYVCFFKKHKGFQPILFFVGLLGANHFLTQQRGKCGRPQLVSNHWSKSQIPKFYGINWPRRWGFFMLTSFFFFLSAFFCLNLPSLPLLFDILKLKHLPTRWGLRRTGAQLNPTAGSLRVNLWTPFFAPSGNTTKIGVSRPRIVTKRKTKHIWKGHVWGFCEFW